MNFNNTKTALNNFADVYTRATELWKQVRHEVMTQYKEDFQHAKLSEAKEIYENTLAEARKDNMNMAEKELDEIRKRIEAVALEPIPEDFTRTVEAFKNMREVTETEYKAIADHFKNNYLAYRAITDVLKDKNFFQPVVKVDDVLTELDYVKGQVRKCIYGSDPNTYIFKATQHESFFAKYEEYFTDFLEGRFEKVGVEPEQAE